MHNAVVDLFDESDKTVCTCTIEIDTSSKLRHLQVKPIIMWEIW